MGQLGRCALMFVLATGLPLGCAVPLTRTDRYTGRLEGCGLVGSSSLVRTPDHFAFAPGDGALIIRGSVASDGRFAGSLNTQPAGKPPYELRVAGRFEADGASLTYVTPTCRIDGHFSRLPVRVLP